MNINELKHYGVLGMRWGIRRNKSKAFRKASKKANRLEEKRMKTDLKSAKLHKKALKIAAKAKYPEDFRGAYELESRSGDLQYKSAKLKNKGMKWAKSMEKEFSNVKMSEISQKDLDIGKKYTYMLLKQ